LHKVYSFDIPFTFLFNCFQPPAESSVFGSMKVCKFGVSRWKMLHISVHEPFFYISVHEPFFLPVCMSLVFLEEATFQIGLLMMLQ
jgi:hypothetical protein